MKTTCRLGTLIFLAGTLSGGAGAAGAAHFSGESDHSRRDSLTLIEPLSRDEAKKARVRVASVGVILQHEKNPQEILKLRLNRAKVLIQLSRRKGAGNTDDRANAEKDLDVVARIPDLNGEQISYLDYLRGLTALDAGDNARGKQLLLQSIESAPQAPYVIGLSLFLADEEYFADHLDAAAREYARFLPRMAPDDRIRALYRMAWIEAKKGNYAGAEKSFLKLTKEKSQQLKDLRRDVLRDLAGLEIKFKDDHDVMDFAHKTLQLKADEEAAFLRDAMLAAQHDGKSPSWAMLNRISALTKNSGDKIRVKLQAVQLQRAKNPAAINNGFEELVDEIEALSPADKKNVLAQDGAELQLENERRIEDLSKIVVQADQIKDAGPRVLKDLAFLEANFHSKNAVPAIKLWLDVCASLKKWECVLERAEKILTVPLFEPLRVAASRERIAALDELSKTDPARYRGQLHLALENYLSDETRPDWNGFAKRLTAIDIEAGAFAAAEPRLITLDRRQPGEDSYYRLELNRFAQGHYSDVIKDERTGPQFQSKRVLDLQHESHLRLAQQASGPGGDFAAYEANLMAYLKEVTDPVKRAKLMTDYYARIEQTGDLTKLSAQLAELPQNSRFSAGNEAITRRLIRARFAAGKFTEVKTLIGPSAGAPEDLRFTAILAALAEGETVPPAQLNSLSSENRLYVLGIYALAATPRLVAYLHDTPAAPREIRELGVLAQKIKSCDALPVTPLEQDLARVEFPKAVKMNAQFSAKLTKTLDKVRALRGRVSKNLSGEPPGVQMRILKAASDLEVKAAGAIASAPLPPGLSEAQTAEYRGRVSEMAKEFENQAEEFQRAVNALNQTLNAKAKSRPVLKKLTDVALWPWPASEAMRNFRGHAENAKLMTALIMLDFLRSDAKSPGQDYWAMRSGLMLEKVQCDAMTDYVFDELTANGQSELIKIWSRL